MTATFINVGTVFQNFYQTMDSPNWEAAVGLNRIQLKDAVFVADAWYGWWFGGFAQRPTLSAVEPAYLTA